MARAPKEGARRRQIVDDLVGSNVMLSDGFAFRTDDALESAYQVWIADGRPRGATLRMDNTEAGQETVVLTLREDGRRTCANCYSHPRHEGPCPHCPCGHEAKTPALPESLQKVHEAARAPAPAEPETPAAPPVLRW
jgi:hypothetical protein